MGNSKSVKQTDLPLSNFPVAILIEYIDEFSVLFQLNHPQVLVHLDRVFRQNILSHPVLPCPLKTLPSTLEDFKIEFKCRFCDKFHPMGRLGSCGYCTTNHCKSCFYYSNYDSKNCLSCGKHSKYCAKCQQSSEFLVCYNKQTYAMCSFCRHSVENSFDNDSFAVVKQNNFLVQDEESIIHVVANTDDECAFCEIKSGWLIPKRMSNGCITHVVCCKAHRENEIDDPGMVIVYSKPISKI